MATQEDPHPFLKLVPAYALDALDLEERLTFGAHLAECQECQAALTDYQSIANGLLLSVPPARPPARLRKRLAEQIRASRPMRKPARRAWSPAWIAFSLAILVLLATNAALALQVRSLRIEQARLTQEIQENQSALLFIAHPDIQTVPVAGQDGQGSLVFKPGTSQGFLFLSDLPALDATHVYQVWLIPRQGAPDSAGLLQKEPQTASIFFSLNAARPIEEYAALGITVEPEGGSPAPTTTPILLAEF
jgi:anti-sigma-K factor RskA